MEYSKKMLGAMARTIRAYEQAILDVEENGVSEKKVAKDWGRWAYLRNCRLCVASSTSHGYRRCEICPLGPQDGACTGGGEYWQVWGGAINAHGDNIGYPRAGWIRSVKARLAWMIKKIGKNGLEVVD